jgi:hypothetical protein
MPLLCRSMGTEAKAPRPPPGASRTPPWVVSGLGEDGVLFHAVLLSPFLRPKDLMCLSETATWLTPWRGHTEALRLGSFSSRERRASLRSLEGAA